ncbi:MAG: hypothetical protein AAFN77_24695 [Planctomycetota bacterium]
MTKSVSACFLLALATILGCNSNSSQSNFSRIYQGLKAGRFHSIEFDCKKTFVLTVEERKRFLDKLNLRTSSQVDDFETLVASGQVILKSGAFESSRMLLSVYKRKSCEGYAMLLYIVDGWDENVFMGPDLSDFLEPQRISLFLDGE